MLRSFTTAFQRASLEQRSGGRLWVADRPGHVYGRLDVGLVCCPLGGAAMQRAVGNRMNKKGRISIPFLDGYTDVPEGKIAAVVTSLEMLAPSKLRSDPPEAPWRLRRVANPDLNWFRDLYRRVGQDWLWFSRLKLTDDALAAVIRDRAVELYALEYLRGHEGLLELDFREAGVCELSFFGITPGLIGKGAGRWLMNRALELAWSRPIRRFWVHTCTLDHPRALAFYLRSGFSAFRRQVEVADDPRNAGILPRNAAPEIPIIDR